MTTTVLPPVTGSDNRIVAAKVGKCSAIGGVAVIIGTIAAGMIAANNPDRIEPATQQALAAIITAAIAGIFSGAWNWIKHR